MKAAIGSVVIVARVFRVAGWLFLVRWCSELEPALAADPCLLEEVACTATVAGRVVHATFQSIGSIGRLVGGRAVGIVRRAAMGCRDSVLGGVSAVRLVRRAVGVACGCVGAGPGGLVRVARVPVEPGARALRGRGPLSARLLMAAFDAPPALVFSVGRPARFEAQVAFDASRVRSVVRTVAAGCGGESRG